MKHLLAIFFSFASCMMVSGQEKEPTLAEAEALLRKVREAVAAPTRTLVRAMDMNTFKETDMECYIVSQGYPVSSWGAQDKAGKEIIPVKYGAVSFHKVSNHYYFHAEDNGRPMLFDSKGRVIIKSGLYDKIIPQDDCIIVEKNKARGVCDWNGKEIVAPKWFWIYPNKNGYLDVRDGDYESERTRYGIIGLDGKVILPCEYTRINDQGKNDTKFVYKNGYVGLYDKNWKMILPCEYSQISFQQALGVYIVAKGGEPRSVSAHNNRGTKGSKWGILATDGTALSPLDYDYIGQYAEDLFLCNKGCSLDNYGDPAGGLFGYIDCKGNVLIPCKYEKAFPFKDGVARVVLNGVNQLLQHPIHGTKLYLANGGGTASKVDTNIPVSERKEEDTFAFIMANENYFHFTGADYSINDGKIFKEYCEKTLGIPEKNIRYLEDATFGNLISLIQKIKDIAEVYDGDAKIIFYFSGLGTSLPNSESYLLPADASQEALATTGYSVQTLMNELNGLNTQMTLVILDAPFSGTDKSGKLLAQHRGVQIVSKPTEASGNTVLCTSSSKAETAYSDKKYSHSLFTYALLENLQTFRGDCTIKETMEYAAKWIKRESMSNYDRLQTLQVSVGGKIQNAWNTIKW